jgi:hypothetical protein
VLPSFELPTFIYLVNDTMAISSHILRRGIEYAHSGMLAAADAEKPGEGDGEATPVSAVAALIFVLTGTALMLGLFLVGNMFCKSLDQC